MKEFVDTENGYQTCNLCDSNKFSQWRASLNYHLLKLPSTTFIKDIFDLIWEFDGGNDDITLNALEVELKVLEENIDDFFPTNTDNHVRPATCEKNLQLFIPKSNKVFIVHGHDGEIKQQVARFLERLDLTAIILNEETNQSMTIIEKLEHHIESASFGIILYTKCDVGRAKNEAELTPRARQNVIFEHGYLYSKLGRNKVVALYESGVELPSDILGVGYTVLDPEEGWKLKLAKELKQAGLDVDMNKL